MADIKVRVGQQNSIKVVSSIAERNLDGDLYIVGDELNTGQTTFNLLETTATNINAFGSATAIDIGANTGITTINNTLRVLDNLYVAGLSTFVGVSTFSDDVFIKETLTVGALIVGDSAFGLDLSTRNLLVSGLSTFTGAADFNGNVDIDGHTELDNLNVSGLSTFIGSIDANGSLDVDGHTELDDVNVSGVSTFTGAADFNGDIDVDGHTELDNLNVSGVSTFAGAADFNGDVDVDGHTELDDVNISGILTATALNVTGGGAGSQTNLANLNVSGVSTFTGAIDANGDLDVDGHTELDSVNVSAASTFGGLVDINAGGQANTFKVEDLTDNRVVIAGTGGELEDDANLTFNGTQLSVGVDLDVDGHTELDDVNVSGVSTFAGAIDANGNLDVDGHTELDNVNVSGLSTFIGSIDANGDLDVDGHTELDDLNVSGVATFIGSITASGGVTFGSVGISSNIISTTSGSGNVLYIDPYPDGLSNEGTVIIKGDLQVDGTTTTVNSSSVTINEPIFNLGDVVSQRTVMATVGSGTTEITLDSVVGINTGDIIDNSGVSGLPAAAGDRTIQYVDTGTKVVSIAANTTGAIGISTQLTITHAYDTNTDRGISFNYNTSSGTGNNKTGFFGFDDNSIATSGTFESHADDSRRWTYIPDASITNSVVTGTKGFLDIKGIYYQSGDFSTHGIVYFDTDGLQRSTSAPSSATFTSTQIMTAVTEIVLTLSSTHSFTAGQQITQANNSAAYGMVKTTTSSSNSVTLIGVEGTFDTTNDLLKEGSNISINPSTVSTTYSDRPVWTTTIDGGTF